MGFSVHAYSFFANAVIDYHLFVLHSIDCFIVMLLFMCDDVTYFTQTGLPNNEAECFDTPASYSGGFGSNLGPDTSKNRDGFLNQATTAFFRILSNVLLVATPIRKFETNQTGGS